MVDFRASWLSDWRLKLHGKMWRLKYPAEWSGRRLNMHFDLHFEWTTGVPPGRLDVEPDVTAVLLRPT
jgi:hypothetical protein